MLNNPFLKAAADGKRDRLQLDRLLTITAPHERLAVGCIGLLVLAFAAWFLFGSVVRSVTLEGLLIVPGERHTVVTGEPGRHLEHLVAPGDRVQAGQTVARRSVPALERELAALRDRLSLLRSQARPAAGDGAASRSLIASAEASLLQMEARRTARQMIVSGFAGVVVELLAAPGEYLPDGAAVVRIHETPNRPVEAVLRVDRSTARRIRPGMEASVQVGLPGGGTRMLRGAVARVIAGPLPNWLTRLEPAVPASSYRIDIVFEDASGFKAADGTACLIRIELGRHAPVDLFLPGRS